MPRGRSIQSASRRPPRHDFAQSVPDGDALPELKMERADRGAAAPRLAWKQGLAWTCLQDKANANEHGSVINRFAILDSVNGVLWTKLYGLNNRPQPAIEYRASRNVGIGA